MKIPNKYSNVIAPNSEYYVNLVGDTIFEKNEVKSRIMTADKISEICGKYSGNGDVHLAASIDGYFKRVRKGYNNENPTTCNWAILRISGKIAVYEGVATSLTPRGYGPNGALTGRMPTANRVLYLQKDDTSSFVDFNVENLSTMINDDPKAMSWLNKMSSKKGRYRGLFLGSVATTLVGIFANIFWIKGRIECEEYSQGSISCPPILRKLIYIGSPLMLIGATGIGAKVRKSNARFENIYKAIEAYNSN
jgi:hypothetical protein